MRIGITLLIASCCFLCCSCKEQTSEVPEKRPRPVVVRVLKKQLPPDSSLVSASVGSWKTEQIGFEVGGRVKSVVEPNTEIEGRIVDKDGVVISQGTPIAYLEDERYQLQVNIAEAELARAKQSLLAAKYELNESLGAQIDAAKATEDLAKIEYERSDRLYQQKAGAKGDVDRDYANFRNATAQLKQLDAARDAKAAEVESLRNQVLQAEENLREANRNLEDCTLYSSFGGQIADVAVVLGSVVTAGEPVATVQIMNPIKVELEVSAEDSRRLQRTERLPIILSMPDGGKTTQQAYLYLIDPVADSLTRTFTVTLLLMNQQVSNQQPESVTATTKDLWRLDFKFLPGIQKGDLYVEEKAILKDDSGNYLWMVTNATTESRDTGDHFYKVRKLRVQVLERKVPYLGNWVFRQVTIDDPEFNPALNVVVGELNVKNGTASEWNGDTVYMDASSQWMLRPGDMVRVDLSGPNVESGYYVAMDAILRKDGDAFIFAVEKNGESTFAKKLPVRIVESAGRKTTSSSLRIEPVDDTELEGVSYVAQGAHYLIDGEPVNPKAGGSVAK